MARYGVAEAKDNLSSLIAKAEAGEEVIITRHGKPAVELKLVRQARDLAQIRAAHAWLREQRLKRPSVGITSLELKRLEQDDHEH